ncbi:hypothetical protein [Nonomuraea longispora]|uniref:TetR/AcrR family transcriptional regulator n=1 Tax=Nonomuraea longispora TaxID=1848320 RepID=UPI00248232B2|nr:hypothetical protein [Nonomuraea longispora]
MGGRSVRRRADPAAPFRQHEPHGRQRMREVFAGQIASQVARLTGADDAEHRAGLVGTQLLGLALTRYVPRFPPAVEADTETLVRETGPVVQHYRTGSGITA